LQSPSLETFPATAGARHDLTMVRSNRKPGRDQYRRNPQTLNSSLPKLRPTHRMLILLVVQQWESLYFGLLQVMYCSRSNFRSTRNQALMPHTGSLCRASGYNEVSRVPHMPLLLDPCRPLRLELPCCARSDQKPAGTACASFLPVAVMIITHFTSA